MRHLKHISFAALVAATLVALPSLAEAQGRHAVPRGSVRPSRPRVVTVVPYRNYYRPYRSNVSLGFFYGSPYYYGPYAYAPFGYGSYGYGYGYGPRAYGPYPYDGYAYGGGYAARPYGGVRIDLPQRDAEVYADGYFLGEVNDFDGVMQQANLEPGPHRIEIRKPGFETLSFDVRIEPGRTITYRASMRPLQP